MYIIQSLRAFRRANSYEDGFVLDFGAFFLQNGCKMCQKCPRRLKIDLGALKIDLLSIVCFQKCSGPMILTHFYRFLIDFGLPFGGYFGEKIVDKSVVFSMLFFSSFRDHFWWIWGCFFELLGGKKSLGSRSRRDLLKSEKT